MINKENIHKMKPGVMLINTGRGKLINTAELIEGLKPGKIGSAGLDVYEDYIDGKALDNEVKYQPKDDS